MPLPKSTQLTGNNSKYRIEKTLGQGDFGIVYAALDSQGKRVAIKEYFPNMLVTRINGSTQVNPHTNSPEVRMFYESRKRWFLERAQQLERFKNDPHIVNLLDCFEANGTAYIVMEFIQGNTLAQVLEKVPNHRLPLKIVIDDLAPIVDVLELIHNTKIKDLNGNDFVLIHLDISPYNIMFSAKATKLMDFGTWRFISPCLKKLQKIYLPPEQFLETGDKLGTWSDVYALAATIYHAITGKTMPLALEREREFLYNGRDILQPPSALGIEITPQQEAALLKGLALEPQERYQTVREFFNALKGIEIIETTEIDAPIPPTPTIVESLPKLPWIVATGAILLAFASFWNMNVSKEHLVDIAKETKELKSQTSKYDYISNNFGYGSSAYYADTPILVLDKDGASGNVPVYWSSWNNSQTTELNANISAPEGIHVKWASEVTNQRRNAIVTSGAESGAYIVHFSNEKDIDAFEVLVVVK